ncbi:MAG: lipoyl synthase [Candidatus Coatesbacteria bacterium]|nr:MAG: lipoyl synthase [Candidatus Coatesbacteria bacterium]
MPRHEGQRLPAWLRRPVAERVGRGEARRAVAGLNTICEEARCPNRGRCMGEDGTATFLVMGPGCSRDCGFCSVPTGPSPLDAAEPARLARAAAELELSYVVLTSPTRDDLADGGASHLVATVEAVRRELPAVPVEVLAPDFGGSEEAVRAVAGAGLAVFGHNVETVPRLYPRVRPGADYQRSLNVLERAGRAGAVTKSALMVGLGESREEVSAVFADLRAAGVAIVIVGQYLRPSLRQLPVVRFWEPEAFAAWEAEAEALGFAAAACAPYVRSSYRAAEIHRRAAAY